MANIKKFAAMTYVAPTAVILPAAMIVLDAAYLLALVLTAAIVHELGHYIALKISHGTVTRVRFGLLGASIEYGGNLSYGGEIITALSGCVANAVLAVCAAITGRLFGFAPAYHLAGLSAVLCAFNLLPAYPLDGGRAIYNACAYWFGPDFAERVTFALRCAVLGALALAGLTLAGQPPYNPTLLICAVLVALNRA